MDAVDTTVSLTAFSAGDWLFILFFVVICILALKPNKFR